MFFSGAAYGQVPNGISFQGVARDVANGECRANENITLFIEIIDGNSTIYSESKTVITDQNGLFFTTIGQGTGSLPSTFEDINWSKPYSIRISEGGNQFGTISLLTAPYAFYSQNGKGISATGSEFLDVDGFNNQNLSGKINFDFDGGDGSKPVVTLANVDAINSSITTKAQIFIDQSDNGSVRLGGKSNQIGVLLGYSDFAGNDPIVQLSRPSSTEIKLYYAPGGVATVEADIKNFVMQHPTQDNKQIVYASLEGPEAAAYYRGTSQLINGQAEVIFPDHFQLVINSETMTISTSPHSAESKGLAVIERTEQGFKVKELFKGTGTYEFDWRVEAVRKGFEDYEVVREKKSDLNE